MHVEYDKLNFLPISKNKNVYPRLERDEHALINPCGGKQYIHSG